MDILFHSDKFKEICNNYKKLKGGYGTHRAKLIKRRLDDLRAANELEIMRKLPGRCHELKGNRAGQLSLDLDGPYRLIFRPANDPIPRKQDSGLDWTKITAIIILGVEDTHE